MTERENNYMYKFIKKLIILDFIIDFNYSIDLITLSKTYFTYFFLLKQFKCNKILNSIL